VIGEKLGSYTIVKELGRGGMGAVYLSIHGVLERKAAIKVLLPEWMPSKDVVKRFVGAAEAVSRIQHPGIVQIYDVGYTPQTFVAMELLEGRTLAERLSSGPMHWTPAVQIAREICLVLVATHRSKIIHRDLKPDNVFLVSDDLMPNGVCVKLLGFDIALLHDSRGTIVDTDTVMGTPWYMSPEQCRGSRDVDGRSDLYSAGCTLFEMITGRVPFPLESAADIMGAHMYLLSPSLQQFVPAVPRELD
jgi:eukaryotic-like serine/threonine-protein kinase